MPEITLEIGADVHASDGPCGQVRSLVVDPRARTVTHLVAEAEGRQGLGRLVPVSLVSASADGVTLSCTTAEFQQLDAADETLTEFIPGHDAPVQLLPSPRWSGGGLPVADGADVERAPVIETVDLVPEVLPGEEEEARGDRLHASDGDIGHLGGLVIDAGTHQVTQVLVREGLGKHAAIPASQVAGYDGGIRLSITRHEVREAARRHS
jgi:hypothetical protein